MGMAPAWKSRLPELWYGLCVASEICPILGVHYLPPPACNLHVKHGALAFSTKPTWGSHLHVMGDVPAAGAGAVSEECSSWISHYPDSLGKQKT